MSDHNVLMAIIRHGQSTGNTENIWEGAKTNSGLSDLGKDQAEETGRYLARTLAGARVIYTSPLLRAFETAHIISRHMNAAIEPIHELCEIDMGELEGKTSHEVMRSRPDVLFLLRPEVTIPLPGGESASSVASRASKALVAIAEMSRPGGRVIVVSHQGTITFGLAAMLDDKASFMRYQPSNCGVTLIEFAPDPELKELDHIDHLRSAGIETGKWVPIG